MSERGLTLSQEKTVITHIEEGFDFLGQNIRKYKDGKRRKLLVKPSRKSIQAHLVKVRNIIKKNPPIYADQHINHKSPIPLASPPIHIPHIRLPPYISYTLR